MLFITQQKRTAPSGLDAAETVRFSWKVVEPQGQREHDVRVSRLTPWMASVGGPVMMRSTWPLSFRKSTVVASIRVRGWQPFLRGFYDPLRYEPCIVKTETAIWELAHKSLFLFLTIYGDSRQWNKCGASFATHLWIECMARNVGLP